jgi:hypothetical protein
MANAFKHIDVLTRFAHAALDNELVLAKMVNREYENEFKKEGSSIRVRKPVRFTVSEDTRDQTSAVQDIEEANWTFTRAKQATVTFQFTSTELTQDVEMIGRRYVDPAARQIAHQIDSFVATTMYQGTYNFVGTPGTAPSTLLQVGEANKKLQRSGLMQSKERNAVLDPDAALAISNAVVFTANSADPGTARTALQNAMIGRYANMGLTNSIHAPTHTVGAHIQGTDTFLVDGAHTADTYAATKDTWTTTIALDTDGGDHTGYLKKGDVFTIAGVEQWNNSTNSSTGQLQDFVVTADADSSSTDISATISPPLIVTGPYRTVSATAADNAVCTVKTGSAATAYSQNLVFNRDAFTLAFADYQAPGGGITKNIISEDGISICYSIGSDQLKHEEYHRLDVIYGGLLQIPQFSCRITS